MLDHPHRRAVLRAAAWLAIAVAALVPAMAICVQPLASGPGSTVAAAPEPAGALGRCPAPFRAASTAPPSPVSLRGPPA